MRPLVYVPGNSSLWLQSLKCVNDVTLFKNIVTLFRSSVRIFIVNLKVICNLKSGLPGFKIAGSKI